MNQSNKGAFTGSAQTPGIPCLRKKNKTQKSAAAMLLGSVFMLALQLLAGSAHALNIPVTAFTCTQTMTATSSCVGNGYYANGWYSPGNGYWQYTINTTGYTGDVTMTFKNTKSSAAGPTSGQVYYNIGNIPGNDVYVATFPVTTSCTQQVITIPGITGNSLVVVKVKMLGATANTATHRITAQDVFDAASSSCAAVPNAGSVSVGASPICGGTSTSLTLTGATAGSGISYQWQSSPDNSTWANISGATNTTYTTPALNATTYYRAIVSCAASASYKDTTASAVVNVNNVAVAPITGYTAPLIVGTTQTLSSATPGGLWYTSNSNIASVDASGNATGVFGGNATLRYEVTDPSTGCVGAQSVNVNVVWPNTLALYAGVNGTSTQVIPVPGDQVSNVYATGFGAATACGSGGISGLTVNVANTAYNEDSAHVGFKVYPDAGKALNVFRIHARARVSGTGPTKARIAYQYWSNGVPSGWIAENADVTLTSGSCGASANSWDFNTGVTANPNPTITGITDSLEVAVFPFAPGANGGTFQLNTLEVYGIVSTDALCNGGIVTTADSVLPAVANICDSGYRFLNYNLGTGGIAGVGIEYQWETSLDGSNWSDITDATGVVYQTPVMHAGVDPDTTYYRMRIICDGSSVAYSEPSIVTVHPTPANAGTISGALPSTGLPYDHVLIGTTYSLSSTVPGGTWRSNDTSVISIDEITGEATPHLPGDAIITYRSTVGGCFGISRDTLVAYHPNTKALYVGRNGNSTNVYGSADATAANLALANWGSAATCGNGGISGLTNTTTVQDPATNGQAVINLSSAGGFNATNVRATLRKQPSGNYQAYLGYNDGSGWVYSAPVAVETDDCGYSHNEEVFTFASPVAVGPAGVDFAVFGFDGTATTTLQINSMSVIGDGVALAKGTVALNLNQNQDARISIYPNPAEGELNITAPEKVNVVIMSIDGKKLIEQKGARVDVSRLVSGMYLVQVYNEHNTSLLKTEKFVKK